MSLHNEKLNAVSSANIYYSLLIRHFVFTFNYCMKSILLNFTLQTQSGYFIPLFITYFVNNFA